MNSINNRITLNMEMRVLVAVLLACSVAGLPVEKEGLPRDILTPLDIELFKDQVLYVYDDNENLVKLTLDEVDVQEDKCKEMANCVSFYLYKKGEPNPKQLYVNDENALKNSNFDPMKPTRFITHGWINSRESKSCTLVRDAYLAHGDYNVIVIDWSPISKHLYGYASKQVVNVGQFVATMIDFLVKHKMDPLETGLIGHSLGAHVVGIAARFSNSLIGLVIGLDPAWPGFSAAGPGSRISSGDAMYVEIIHTNGGVLGFLHAIGDADFYPNGGEKQLGCRVDACSHARSFRFYAESITSQVGFHGKSCSTFLRFKMGLCDDGHSSIMGGHKPLKSARGNYYLHTNPSPPFASGPHWFAMRR
ncbi:pancreatic triacylglycerol lipase [Monomorium pharaonis]|uniref:pancreatic triacylglycerol lipase n=1 Tax=Monomorium pharaonis TaxID=307658 RepID=UPI00063F8985|nr:pancreatic triacylglycerol lipase [Monomorium pharaonis]